MNQDLTVELAPFAVANGVTEQTLTEASDRLERDFLSKTDGYIGRFLLRMDGGKWADLVFWGSREHAAKAMDSVASSDACRAYFSCMQPASPDDPEQGPSLFGVFRGYGAMDF